MESKKPAAKAPPDPELVAFGLRMRAARNREELTLDEVGTRLGYTSKNPKGTVSAWETGRGIPDAMKLRQACRLYRVSADALLWEEPPFSAGWPFPDIDRRRFDALTAGQRQEIQGVVRKMLIDFESSRRPGTDEQEAQLTSRGAEAARQRLAEAQQHHDKQRRSSSKG